jgi:hypothetical protein
VYVRRSWPLLFAALLGLSACGPEESHQAIPLAGAGALTPPTLLRYAPGQGLIALVNATDEAGGRQLTLWRADSSGTDWSPWAGLGRTNASGHVALAVTKQHVVVAGVAEPESAAAGGGAIWIARVPLAAPAAGAVETMLLATGAPVLALALDAPYSREAIDELIPRPPDALEATPPAVGESTGAAVALTEAANPPAGLAPFRAAPRDTLPWVHLVYLQRATAEQEKRIVYRRSRDAGASWSAPETLAEGDLGRPGLFARSRFRTAVDVCYPRGDFMCYRGGGGAGEQWRAERPIRLRVAKGSSNGIARHERELLVACENDLHQVAGATSLNGGFNWERAIAIARSCDHVRLPALDHGGGLFWAGYSQGDSVVVVRSTRTTLYPRQWNRGIIAAEACCLDAPDIAALPGGAVGVLFATPEGRVYFTRVQQ